MRKILLIACLFFFLFIQTVIVANPNSTPRLSIIYSDGSRGDRFGDQLIVYIRSKWISYKNHLPLYVRPFEYYDCLKASDIDLELEILPQGFNCKRGKDIDTESLKKFDHIYIVTLYPLLSDEFFDTLKKESTFLKQLRELISPKEPLNLITPPKDSISIAVHIRNGGGYDNPLKSVQIFSQKENHLSVHSEGYQDETNPLKFPPEQYYIDQIKRISKILSHKPIYLFIFTDDKNPSLLAKRIKKNVNLDNIIFDCRKSDTRHDKNILEDFFSMLNFDCLIRPGKSYFSKIIHLLGDFKIEIFPTNFHWIKDKKKREYLIMDDIETLIAN